MIIILLLFYIFGVIYNGTSLPECQGGLDELLHAKHLYQGLAQSNGSMNLYYDYPAETGRDCDTGAWVGGSEAPTCQGNRLVLGWTGHRSLLC